MAIRTRSGPRQRVRTTLFSKLISPKPVTFDHSLTMEWLNDGQHIEHYRIETWDGKNWTAATEGRSIGHRKIDRFPPVTTSRVRLNILESSAQPHVREFQVFRIGKN